MYSCREIYEIYRRRIIETKRHRHVVKIRGPSNKNRIVSRDLHIVHDPPELTFQFHRRFSITENRLILISNVLLSKSRFERVCRPIFQTPLAHHAAAAAAAIEKHFFLHYTHRVCTFYFRSRNADAFLKSRTYTYTPHDRGKTWRLAVGAGLGNSHST